MTDLTVQQVVDDFTGKIEARLDGDKLEGPVRLDPTRTVVILKLRDKGPIHVHTNHRIDDAGVEYVIRQISLVPSLAALVKQG
jgi:hypothetical protein